MDVSLIPGMRRLSGSIALSLSLLLLMACKRPIESYEPEIDLPRAFSNSGVGTVPQKWWTVFESDELDHLVQQSIRSNFDLLQAWERLEAARAVLRGEASLKWPQLDGRLQAQTQEPASGSGDSIEVGLFASYEADLWGRIQSRVDAQRFRIAATEADYQTAILTLSAELTLAYLELLTADAQRQLIGNQVQTNEKIYDSLKSRFGAGQGQRGDLLRQAQLIESTRGQAYLADARIGVLQNRLAVLAGRLPGEIDSYSAASWPQLPELPDTGLPSELIWRRPDVHAAYNRLKAADEELAAAVAETYPRISINGSLTTENNDFEDIFEDWVRNLAGNIVMPLFDAGSRRAEVERNEALRRQSLYACSQTLLTAVQEVEDALVLEKRQSQRLSSLQEQVRLAREAHRQLQLEYINGAADFLDVLTALTNQQRLGRDLLSARLDLYESRIALYRAIAGPAETDPNLSMNQD